MNDQTSYHDDLTDLDRAPAYLLYRVARRSQHHLRQCLKKWGTDVSPEQWFTLFRLRSLGPSPMSALADSSIEDYPNITRLVRGLEDRGLVVRRSDAKDGRVRRVALTKRGKALVERIDAEVPHERRRMFDGVSSGELRTFEKVLRKIETNLSPR